MGSLGLYIKEIIRDQITINDLEFKDRWKKKTHRQEARERIDYMCERERQARIIWLR